MSTAHLTMKYLTDRGIVCTVRADQKIERECYVACLKLYLHSTRRKVAWSEVAMTNLDPRTNTEDQIEPWGEL